MISRACVFFLAATLATALACALPGARGAAADTPRGAVPLSGLDKMLVTAIERALTPPILKELGYADFDAARRDAFVRVDIADCPAACGTKLDRGLCLCAPEAKGDCPAPGAAASRGGDLLCTSLPGNITIFSGDGGLGTTRILEVSPFGRTTQ